MILTTTNTIEGFEIIDYLGIVTGVAIYKGKIAVGFSLSKYYNSIQNSVDEVKEKKHLKNLLKMRVNKMLMLS